MFIVPRTILNVKFMTKKQRGKSAPLPFSYPPPFRFPTKNPKNRNHPNQPATLRLRTKYPPRRPPIYPRYRPLREQWPYYPHLRRISFRKKIVKKTKSPRIRRRRRPPRPKYALQKRAFFALPSLFRLGNGIGFRFFDKFFVDFSERGKIFLIPHIPIPSRSNFSFSFPRSRNNSDFTLLSENPMRAAISLMSSENQ